MSGDFLAKLGFEGHHFVFFTNLETKENDVVF
jgi:hypothetical protein